MDKRYRIKRKGLRGKKGGKGSHGWTPNLYEKKVKAKNGDYKDMEIKEYGNKRNISET